MEVSLKNLNNLERETERCERGEMLIIPRRETKNPTHMLLCLTFGTTDHACYTMARCRCKGCAGVVNS